jgi:hypothetical protein
VVHRLQDLALYRNLLLPSNYHIYWLAEVAQVVPFIMPVVVVQVDILRTVLYYQQERLLALLLRK